MPSAACTTANGGVRGWAESARVRNGGRPPHYGHPNRPDKNQTELGELLVENDAICAVIIR